MRTKKITLLLNIFILTILSSSASLMAWETPPCGDCYTLIDYACQWVGCDPTCSGCKVCSEDCSGCIDDEDACADCYKCDDDGECVCSIESVSASAEESVVPVNTDVTFTADISPSGDADCISWSGGGETGSGSTFVTSWGEWETGNQTVTLTWCDSEEDQTTSAGVTVVKVSSITYQSDAKVWKGTEVTWQVETEPSGYYDMVEVSGIGSYDSDTGIITYDCPSSSASSSTKFTDITATCGNSITASDGPVVYHLLSAICTPDVVCLDEDSQLVYTLSPADPSGPVPTFTGTNIDTAGFIDNDDPAQISVGWHEYTATGDLTLDDKLTVLTFTSDQWTTINIPEFEYPADPSADYDLTETYVGLIDTYQLRQIGTIQCYEKTLISGWISQSVCGNELTDEDTYEYGISYSYSKYGLTVSFGTNSTTTVSFTLAADPKRRYRARLLTPAWEVVDERDVWYARIWNPYLNDGDGGWDEWYNYSTAQDVFEMYVKLIGGAYETGGACCQSY